MRKKAEGPKLGVKPPALGEWRAEDTSALAAFLRTRTGKNLTDHYLAAIAGYNEWATRTKEETPDRACGIAQGFTKAFQFTISLAAAHSSKTEPPADSNGTAGSLDRLRP